MDKYTIVIPTRDRAETLDATIRSCLRQRYENLEIIVSDNESMDNTKALVNSFGSDRIRYLNTGNRLSMSGNFDYALRHVSDGFVMFIGADDGVLPDAVEYVSTIVKRHGVDAVSCRQASYVWPNFSDKSIAGKFSFGGPRDDVEIRRTSDWIKRTLNFQSPYCFDLPNLYCGFVRKSVIDKGYRHGRYFHSINPDAYAAFAAGVFLDRYAFSHRPFVIAGASSKSNGASSMHAVGGNDEFLKFNLENDIEFREGYISCASFEVAAGEAFAKLAEMFPERCAPYKVNHEAMLRGALNHTNDRTRAAVEDAVNRMAAHFGVDLSAPPTRQPKDRSGRLTLRQSIDRYVSGLRTPRCIEMARSMDLGIDDVDDAALAAYVLSKQFDDSQVTTTRSVLTQRLKRKIGLK